MIRVAPVTVLEPVEEVSDGRGREPGHGPRDVRRLPD
jgi:hypothetical protein